MPQMPPVSALAAKTKSISNVIKAFLGVVFFLGLLSFIPQVYKFFAVIPAEIVPPHVRLWKLVTGSYVEPNFFLVLVDVVVIALVASEVEPVWGGLKFMEMLLIVNAVSVISTFLLHILLFNLSNDDLSILFTPFSGFSSGILCLVVAYTQAFPQASISIASFKIYIHSLPVLLIAGYVVLHAIGVFVIAVPALAIFGFVWGWCFLRFFQVRNGIKGDDSDEFSFESFFPQPLRPIMKFIGPKLYLVLRAIKLCPSKNRSFSLTPAGVKPTAQAQRWMTKANKDLDMQLKNAPLSSVSSK